MITLVAGTRSIAQRLAFKANRGIFPSAFALYRTYSTPQKKTRDMDISQVPIKNISVVADFYIPPSFLTCPIKSWPRLVFRRLGLFVLNTYSIIKFKRETIIPLQFNKWKDQAIDLFVKTNKIFAAGCNQRESERRNYITTQLNDILGVELINALAERTKTFPTGTKIQWDLVSIVGNPRIVMFNSLPDSYDNTAYIQFVMRLSTKQKLSLKLTDTEKVTERTITDHLVYTFNPWSDEMVLVGSLFELDHLRKIEPDYNFTNPKVIHSFGKIAADIYRANPKT